MPQPHKTPSPTRKTGATAKDTDAIALLKADHREVEAMFKQFDKMKDDGGAREKGALVTKICEALTVHTTIEEDLFYPALRKAFDEDGEDMLDEAEVEHAGAKRLVAELEKMKPDDRLYDAKVTVLTEYIKHHVKEEETEMFPKAKKMVDTEALGERLARRKKELQE